MLHTQFYLINSFHHDCGGCYVGTMVCLLVLAIYEVFKVAVVFKMLLVGV